ncbi:TonB-linked SusC/RagA family outer membrane protein [Sphingobacterium allocomposti]|uniref:TonB-linked SusC/RagA family outer membrane protein n=1 Tax=Sphingobacterium allocomposti TaxID=415956 RepID=A0A5S5DIS6_9SPHI|nr:TonB-linked SusC/RagA family outer membrane protein [Sphingobacterium composti Yoo et al. 2007 non Ten et al. 2007]
MNNFYKGGRGLSFFKHLFRLFKSRNNRSRTLYGIAIRLCFLMTLSFSIRSFSLMVLKNIRILSLGFLCFMLFSLPMAWAQSAETRAAERQKTVLTGEVLCRKNATPLESVSISTKSGVYIGRTGTKGRFEFSVPSGVNVLLFSRVGYKSLEYNIDENEQNPIQITLDTLENILDEAVVIGYGSTTRRLSTGSVTKVSAKEIERQPVSNPMLALQGLVPGLEVSPSSGISGASVNLKIRGTGSLAQGTEPLVVLNGNPIAVNGQEISQLVNPTGSNGISLFNGINPADIESIEVLKDADATAIYGSRGANGVILITTKRNAGGDLKVEIYANNGISVPSNPMKLLNTTEYLMMRREALANSNMEINETNAPDLVGVDTMRYTDFRKQLSGATKRNQDWNIGLSGGSGLTTFRINSNFQRENFQVSNDRGSKRYAISSNIHHYSKDRRFDLDLGVNFSQNESNLTVYDPSVYLTMPPHIVLQNTDGGMNWMMGSATFRSLGLTNPLGQFENTYQGTFKNLISNLSLGYRVRDDLRLKISSGYTWGNNTENSFYPSTGIDPSTAVLPSAQSAAGSNHSWIVEPQLLYNKRLGKHNIDGLLGASIQQSEGRNTTLIGTNFVDDLFLGDMTSAGTLRPSFSETQYKYAALFTRLGYQYNKKYLVNLSARRDGSSRFGPGTRYATFYSAAAAWIFSEEPIFRSLLPGISYGKIRGSVGQTGNDRIGNYMFMDTWSSLGDAYNGIAGVQPTRLFNPDYSWEKNRKAEVALELGTWEDRLLFSLSHYRNESSNQLISYALPFQTGFSTINRNWDATIRNRGWEITLDGRLIEKEKISWNVRLNLSVHKNRLTAFPGLETSSYARRYVIGEPLSVRRVYKYLGIDREEGIYTFEDVNGDGVWNVDDQTVLVNTDPQFFGGLSSTLNYKRWTLGLVFDFRVQRGLSYIASLTSPPGYSVMNHPTAVLDRWRVPGDEATFQRFAASSADPAYAAAQRFLSSDAVIVDASYVKLRNCYLSYTWQRSGTNVFRMVNVFLTAQNLLTFSGYEGGDPEIQNPFITSPMRVTSLGLKLNF